MTLPACSGGGNGGSGGGSASPAPERPRLAFSDAFSAGHTDLGFTTFPAGARRTAETEPRFTEQGFDFQERPGAPIYTTYHPDTIGLAHARSLGLSGTGSLVAVIDDGFRQTHETFRATSITAVPGIVPRDHGTRVASRIAGDRYGVAPGAALHLLSYETTLQGLAGDIDAARRAGSRIQNNSWAFANGNALAASGSGSLAARLAPQIGGSEAAVGAYVDALEAFAVDGVLVFSLSNEPDASGVPAVAGLPLLEPRLTPAWIAVANGAIEARRDPATGLARRDDGRVRIESVTLLSQPCGAIAFTCITTEATGLAAAGFSDTASGVVGGTSLAAPQVSAALAILAEAFPDAHMHDLRRRLLAAANDSFFVPDGTVDFGSGVVKGFSDEYGHGVLDLRAALMPIGSLGFSTADLGPRPVPNATAPQEAVPLGRIVPLAAAVMMPGQGMGDALVRGLSQRRIVVRDGLGGRFDLAGDALAVARPARRDGGGAGEAMSHFLQRRTSATAVGFRAARDLAAALGGFVGSPDRTGAAAWGAGGAIAGIMPGAIAFSVAPPGLDEASFAVHVAQDEADNRSALLVGRTFRPQPGLALSMAASYVDERESLLGLRPAGRSSLPRGHSLAVSLGAAADVSRLFEPGPAAEGKVGLELSAELGTSRPTQFGAMGETGTVGFSSLGARVTVASLLQAGDSLALSASQPMRVERGTLRMNIAEVEPAGNGLRIPLAPSGRQVDIAVNYNARLLGGQSDAPATAGLYVAAGAVYSFDHEHRDDARAASGYAALALRF